ncbi:hypothetical protein PG999_005376 [Apiospora kogelbergensis]|uniref:Uncharacterized protein n=1 Tax=Apiospora kogelbergensis TaxID=1337665 RepID=A0AAW0R1X8_9PEZI
MSKGDKYPRDMDWVEDPGGTSIIPSFLYPCQLCVFLKRKTGSGGKCLPSFAPLHEKADRNVSVAWNGNCIPVRAQCTTCVGFGEACVMGGTPECPDDPAALEAKFMQNDVIKDLVSRPAATVNEEEAKQ